MGDLGGRRIRTRNFKELNAHPDAWRELLDRARSATVTLLCGARDEEHNQAVVPGDFLERKA